MGRWVWLPWVAALSVAVLAAVFGYPDWVAGGASAVVFIVTDYLRHPRAAAARPLIRSRREAWTFAMGEPAMVAFGLLCLLYAFTGWESTLPTLFWALGLLAMTLVIQLLNVVEARAGPERAHALRDARREAWSMVRSKRTTD